MLISLLQPLQQESSVWMETKEGTMYPVGWLVCRLPKGLVSVSTDSKSVGRAGDLVWKPWNHLGAFELKFHRQIPEGARDCRLLRTETKSKGPKVLTKAQRRQSPGLRGPRIPSYADRSGLVHMKVVHKIGERWLVAFSPVQVPGEIIRQTKEQGNIA